MNWETVRGRKTSRRDFIRAGGAGVLLAGASSLAGCDFLSTDADGGGAGQGDSTASGRQKEAPSLAERVKAGELPPVEERLPEQPQVVELVDRAGSYEGELTSAIVGAAEAIQLHRLVFYECLVRWTPAWDTDVIPNIAESFEATDDARQFTFKLREGMRWSDGEPFTAEDLVFAQNDVFNNLDLYPSQSTNPLEAELLDDYSVRFTFQDPNGFFLYQQATQVGTRLVTAPAHYLKQFHKEYSPDVEDLAAQEGFDDWTQLFLNRLEVWSNAELSTLYPWVVTTPLGEGTRITVERNPYYWKTDPDGRQLPYVDRIVFDVVNESEVVLTRALSGEIDLQFRPINALENRPVLARNRESAGYRFISAEPTNMNTMSLGINLTHKDQALREIFGNKDFRIWLSHAINREEIIDTVYARQGEPYQLAPRPESSFYDEEFAKQYTEYNVDTANEHLDRVVPDKDGDGFRLRVDGERVFFTVMYPNGLWADHPDVLELVSSYWRDVGIEMRVSGVDRALLEARAEASEHDAIVWDGKGGGNHIFMPMPYYFPSGVDSYYARPWAAWYTSNGEEGEEPPETATRQMDLFDRIEATVDAEEQTQAMTEILQIAKEEFYAMGINLQPEEFGIATNRLGNVPDAMPFAWDYPTPAPTNPEQYFIEEPS